MYSNFYRQSSELADMIRSGEYRQQREKKQEKASSFFDRPQPQETIKQEDSMLDDIANTIAILRSQTDQISPDVSSSPQPQTYVDGKQTKGLINDSEFMANVKHISQKYGVSDTELFNIIKGESGFNPTAQNKTTKATGLFQFMPATAKELGVSINDIKQMSPSEQLDLYDMYLERWGYQGEGLGIMQAAPAYRDAGDNDVIYDVGSAAWEANPAWRTAGGGPITKASINRYYRRQR